MLSAWGVTPNKDLVLDISGIGQMFGAGPEIPIILQYDSHAITRPLAQCFGLAGGVKILQQCAALPGAVFRVEEHE